MSNPTSNLEKQNDKNLNANSNAKPTRLGRGLGSLLGESVNTNFLDNTLPKPAVTLDEKPPLTFQAPPTQEVIETRKEALREAVAVSRSAPDTISDENRIWTVQIDKLSANTFQPRQMFNKDKIQELANSIKEQGILQPIVARKSGDGKFEIIAGERRWRAAQLAGLHEVPVILKAVDDKKSLELALIENIQRENLNPIEEAEAYEQLIQEFQMTQQEVSEKVGKERTTVTNALRLLTLVPEVKRMLSEGLISAGHAKALLAITDPIKQREVAKRIASERLTVRAAEKLVRASTQIKDSEKIDFDVTQGLVEGLAEELQKSMGTKVQIDYSNQKGKISIHFYSDDELTQLSERLKSAWKKPESLKTT